MGDSVQILQGGLDIYRIHSQSVSGKIHKGHVVRKPQSSIPSKYHTVVLDNADRKGFNSSGKRFLHDANAHVTPSPNNYATANNTLENNAPSLSKKGTGGFASKSSRSSTLDTVFSPGPGKYDLRSPASTSDFNTSNSSSFHRPIAVQREVDNGIPPPGSYNPLQSLAALRKGGIRDLDSVFKSSSKRQLINLTEAAQKPGPASYTISTADKVLGPGGRVPLSSFKQSGPRVSHAQINANPGPGAYNPKLGDFSSGTHLLFPMKHYLCLSAPALPLPPTMPEPGPGQYEVAKRPVSRHYMTSSMFLSNTSRWGGLVASKDPLPGPAHYKPVTNVKNNFLYNAEHRWVV